MNARNILRPMGIASYLRALVLIAALLLPPAQPAYAAPPGADGGQVAPLQSQMPRPQCGWRAGMCAAT